MLYVLLTALGVGGATVLGAVAAFLVPNPSRKQETLLLSLAAGIMTAAAVVGLILPAGEGSFANFLIALLGIGLGGWCLGQADRLVPKLSEAFSEARGNTRLHHAVLFLLSMAIHNFPEGMAAGVGFGCDSLAGALLISGGIALQNVPEGMVIIAPMLEAGISRKKTLLCALFTGFCEVVGTFFGYFIIRWADWVQPFALGFAGGTMLFLVVDEMIPQAHNTPWEKAAVYTFLAGFCLLLICDRILG